LKLVALLEKRVLQLFKNTRGFSRPEKHLKVLANQKNLSIAH
jgi:hypothetical protein